MSSLKGREMRDKTQGSNSPRDELLDVAPTMRPQSSGSRVSLPATNAHILWDFSLRKQKELIGGNYCHWSIYQNLRDECGILMNPFPKTGTPTHCLPHRWTAEQKHGLFSISWDNPSQGYSHSYTRVATQKSVLKHDLKTKANQTRKRLETWERRSKVYKVVYFIVGWEGKP